MTDLLYISVVLNVVLIAVIGALFLRARQRIFDEKVATFGGCLAALSLGLLREDRQRGTDAIVEGLRRMRPGMNGDELKYRLLRAAACRLQRNDVSFDLLGETMHVVAPIIYPTSDKNEKIADYVHDLDYSKGNPQELYGDEGLFLAEIQEEKYILEMYRASFSKTDFNPFKTIMSPVLTTQG